MSREIKFRAWSKFPKKMLDMSDACYYLLPFGKLVQITVDKKHRAVHRELDTVVQLYTGFKDCKGVEIYEGDIVKILDDDDFKNTKWEVVWDDATLQFIAVNTKPYNKYSNHDSCALCCLAHNFEVIGNIYQNKELLK